MSRHHVPDSGFDETTGSYPDTRDPRVAYRRGFLSGLILAWTAAMVMAVVYLVLVR